MPVETHRVVAEEVLLEVHPPGLPGQARIVEQQGEGVETVLEVGDGWGELGRRLGLGIGETEVQALPIHFGHGAQELGAPQGDIAAVIAKGHLVDGGGAARSHLQAQVHTIP